MARGNGVLSALLSDRAVATRVNAAQRLNDAAERQLNALRHRAGLLRLAFILLVVVPTVLTAIFYAVMASKRYVSEVQFIVRSVSSQRATGLDILFRTFGMSRTVDDGHAVQKYLQSRDLVKALDAEIPLRTIFNRDDGDFFSRYPYFWRADSFESLYDYFLNRVIVTEDAVKGIIMVNVITFRADDSRRLATELVKLAEAMVNRMNTRAQRDAVGAGEAEVARAEQRVIDAQAKITSFRNQELLVDPGKSSISLIELLGELSAEVSNASAQLKELRVNSPSSPALPSAQARVTALEERVRIERAKLAGDDSALAAKIASYEQLALMRDLADRTLSAATTALDGARQEARRQHIYIESISAPNLPDEATEPKRLRNIFTVFVLGIAVFSVIWIISVGAGEHAQ
jgi:capsular polysaccharide transport system permease protein